MAPTTSEENLFDKTVKLPLFSIKAEDWPIWSEKFLIQARRKGYKNVLLGKEMIPKEDDPEDPGKSADKKKEAKWLLELNEIAFEEIEMAIDTTKG